MSEATTTHDAIVSMAMILLRHRREWNGKDTAESNIALAVAQCWHLLGEVPHSACADVIRELKQRVFDDASKASTGQWPERNWRGT